MADSDEMLAMRVQDTQDRAAFGELVQRHQGPLRARLRGLCKDHHLADDIAQEAFLTAWQQLGSWRGTGTFGAWLGKLAYNRWLHQLRHTDVVQRHATATRALASDDPSAQAQDLGDSVALDAELARLLAPVSEAERELLVMAYAFELSIAELAAHYETPTGTIKARLHRARQKILAAEAKLDLGNNPEGEPS